MLGDNNPDTLVTRGNLAYWLGRAGRVDEAFAAFEKLLEDQLRRLGEPCHTLKTRYNLADVLGRAGQIQSDRCIQELAENRRLRGTITPTRSTPVAISLVCWGGRVGLRGACWFEQLLEDQRRVLGEDHRETLKTRSVADMLGGRVGLAERLLRSSSFCPRIVGC